MPFVKWSVEPVFLSKKSPVWATHLSEGRDSELTTTSNNTLVNVLRQLASLVQIANEIFTEVGDECNQVYTRAEHLKQRLTDCQSVVEKLNAKTVKVPVGDLTQFSLLTNHFESKQVSEADPFSRNANFFTSDTRPTCVRHLYRNAAATPVHIIRTIDQYRQDGRTGSKIFMCMPVIGDQKTSDKCDMDIETRRPASVVVVRDAQTSDADGDADEILEEQPIQDSQKVSKITAPSVHSPRHELIRLPSPEEQMHALSLEYPSSVVPIDITGSNFQRMSSVRRSLIHVDFFIRRKKKKKAKRRNTISEGNNKEIREALREESASCTNKKDSGKVEKVNNSCQTEVEVEVHRYCRFLPLRRSFQRKSIAMPEEENNNLLAKLDKRCKSKDDVAGLHGSLDLKASKDWKPGRKSKKAEDIASSVTKLKLETDGGKKNEKTSNKNKGRSYIPISTVSAAMTVAVKMRETMTRSSTKNGEDGRSSSGNWSAGSSNRVSVDSDNHRVVADSMDMIHSNSDSSLGKDSVISDNTQHDTDGRSQDGTLTGYTSDTSAAATATTVPSRWRPSSLIAQQVTALDTDTWLQSLDQDARSNTLTPDYMSDSASTPLVLSPYLYRRDANVTDISHGSMDDGESSVYSVDTDGYYTSMHTDSGLKTHSLKYNFSGTRHLRRGSESSVGTLDNSSLNSVLSRTATEPSSNCSTLTKREKIPPPPPPRISSAKTSTNTSKVTIVANEEKQEAEKIEPRSHSPSPTTTNGSTSESEHEVLERLRRKTVINSSRYPSMCAVSPVPSEDDTSKSEKSASEGKPVIHQDSTQKDNENLVQRNDVISPPTVETVESAKAPSPNSNTSPKINMYGDQSPQKSKFVDMVTENPSNNKNLNSPSLERQTSLSSFSPTSQKYSHLASSTISDDAVSIADSQDSSISKASHHFSMDMLSSSPSSYSEIPKNSIPLKYTHCITVTPKARENRSGFDGRMEPNIPSTSMTPTHVQAFLHSTLNKSHSLYSNGCSSSVSPSNPVSIPTSGLSSISDGAHSFLQTDGRYNYHTPTSFPSSSPTSTSPSRNPTANRPVARVTLDPEGRVIYMSNSLGRRRDGHPLNCTPPSSPTEAGAKFATLPMYHPHGNGAVYQGGVHNPVIQTPHVNQVTPADRDLSPHHRMQSPNIPTCMQPSKESSKVYSAIPVCKSSIPSTVYMVSPVTTGVTYYAPIYQSSAAPSRLAPCHQPIYSNVDPPSSPSKVSYIQPQTSLSNSFMPSSPPHNPHIGSPPLNLFATSSPIRSTPLLSHLQRPQDLSLQMSTSLSVTPCSTPSSSISQNVRFGSNSTNGNADNDEKDRKKPMTTEDLFAVIHSSKKRHNIKTDLEVSPSPHSSRSNSPCGRPSTPSRSVLAETGFLSPRNAQNLMARDRQSWAGDNSKPMIMNVPGERKSLANDRFGPVKPTSMHDFKMLLLQARRTNPSTGERRSAAEILRSTAPQPGSSPTYQMNGYSEPNGSPQCSSPGPQSLPTSPTKSLSSKDSPNSKSSWNGHSTVPLKRGVRARSSLQNRYELMLYPPIMEEDLEASRDVQRSPRVNPVQPLLVQNAKPSIKENGYIMPSGINHNMCSELTPVSNAPLPSSSTWV